MGRHDLLRKNLMISQSIRRGYPGAQHRPDRRHDPMPSSHLSNAHVGRAALIERGLPVAHEGNTQAIDNNHTLGHDRIESVNGFLDPWIINNDEVLNNNFEQ